MDIAFLLKGAVVGFLASIPLGPIGVLCIQRTITRKFKVGFISGMGAASADTIFSVVAMFFLSLVMSFIEEKMKLMTIIGGLIIIVVGLSIFLKKQKLQIKRNRTREDKIFKDYISIFFLTLTNPAYILVFVALFASSGIDKDSMSIASAVLAITGVFAGALTWWFILTFSISLVRKKFRPRHIVALNKIAGLLIITLGIVAVVSSVFNKSESMTKGVETIIKK